MLLKLNDDDDDKSSLYACAAHFAFVRATGRQVK